MHKNNGATKVFPETTIPKRPKTLSKMRIFLKIKLRINEKINLPQMLPLTFKALGTAQSNVSCCLSMFRFQGCSKPNLKHIFPICVTYTCHLPLLRKLKKQFHRLLLHTFNMKWAIGFRIVNGIIVISVLKIY